VRTKQNTYKTKHVRVGKCIAIEVEFSFHYYKDLYQKENFSRLQVVFFFLLFLHENETERMKETKLNRRYSALLKRKEKSC
jgi:hypothetical protein